MLIIVEGPDGAGKTTLVPRLVQAIRRRHPNDLITVWPKGPPKVHPLDEYESPIWDYRPGTGKHLICDRWHLGELVYPKILNRGSELDAAAFRHIELLLLSRGAVVMYLSQDRDLLRQRIAERGDDLITPDMIDRIVDGYENVLSYKTVLHVSSFYGGEQEDAAADNVISILDARDAELSFLNRFRTYVGPPNPSLLLLGDTRGPWRGTPPGNFRAAPAFVPYPATSGNYLLHALEDACAASPRPNAYRDWSRIGVANACDVDDPAELIEALGYPPVVTLGNKALGALGPPSSTRSRIVRATAHPQYVRRFHHARRKEYGCYIVGRGPEPDWRGDWKR